MPQKKATKRVTPQRGEIASYQEFLKDLRLTAMGMDECAAKLDRLAYAELRATGEKSGLPKTVEVSVDYCLEFIEGNHFDAAGTFELNLAGAEGETSPLEIQC